MSVVYSCVSRALWLLLKGVGALVNGFARNCQIFCTILLLIGLQRKCVRTMSKLDSKVPCINALISSTDEYCRYKSEVISGLLLQHLQGLSSGHDTSIFDPEHKDTPKLYLCLHQLISTLDPNSSVLWAAVMVVQKCCISLSARTALVSNYKFLDPLTELLLADLTHDKKICVLHILLDLTKEMEVLQKEPSVLSLTSKLVENIMTEGADVARYSLSILANVCNNNTSLVYGLKSCINSRFFRSLLNFKDDGISAKVQMCKLLFILEPISLAVDGPPDIARTILDITFSNLIEAYEKRETSLLNDIVKFFKELSAFPKYTDTLHSYDRCPEFTQKILNLLECCDDETVVGVFDFIHILLSVNALAPCPLYPQIMKISLLWLETDEVCVKVLGILKAILKNLGNDSLTCTAEIHLLEQHLSNILELYEQPKMSDPTTYLIALLLLLQEMIKFDELREKLLHTIDIKRIEEIFSESSIYSTDANCCKNIMMLHVCALSFLSSLASYDFSYQQLRDKLLRSPQVLKTLAASFYEGSVRKQVLEFTATLQEESLSPLAKELSLNFFSEMCNHSKEDTSSSLTETSSISLVQGCQFDALVDSSRLKLDNNELNIPISTVMTLLEYKVAATSRTEQNLNSNLEIIHNNCAEVQQRLLQINSGIQQKRELLFKNQQCAENLHGEVQELKHIFDVNRSTSVVNQQKYQEELNAKENFCCKLKLKCEDMKDNVKKLHELMNNVVENLASVEQQIATNTNVVNDQASRFSSLEQELRKQESQYIENMKKFNTLSTSLKRSEKVLEEREIEAASLKKEKASLEMEVADLQMVREAQEKTAVKKDEEIQKLQKSLSELERIRDIIANISSGKTEV